MAGSTGNIGQKTGAAGIMFPTGLIERILASAGHIRRRRIHTIPSLLVKNAKCTKTSRPAQDPGSGRWEAPALEPAGIRERNVVHRKQCIQITQSTHCMEQEITCNEKAGESSIESWGAS